MVLIWTGVHGLHWSLLLGSYGTAKADRGLAHFANIVAARE